MPADNKQFGSLPRDIEALDETSVHHIRKGTKQLRAHLHLLRQLEGPHRETEKLRQSVKKLARLLAGQRDADVMHGLLDQFINTSREPALISLMKQLQDGLQHERLPARALQHIKAQVKDIENKRRVLSSHRHGEKAISQVLDARLVGICVSGEVVLAEADWQALHNWRKQVKQLMYQYALKKKLTARDSDLVEHLDHLGDCLGRINDLCVLENYVTDREKAFTRASDLELFGRVRALIDTCRKTELERCNTEFEAICRLREARQ